MVTCIKEDTRAPQGLLSAVSASAMDCPSPWRGVHDRRPREDPIPEAPETEKGGWRQHLNSAPMANTAFPATAIRGPGTRTPCDSGACAQTHSTHGRKDR